MTTKTRYQPRNSTEHEPTASTIILGGALAVAIGAAVVLIATFAASGGLRWMCGCWRCV